ncbi:patatin-like phospholipase family protein [Neolewinella litorea]|uniref:Patatin n=1 Tax=Neolewinella litorea TaxID=2562452 RepID=A0A4S4NNU5_9BACT|nr:patatin-like phospholipase family protein [Neolewinella litorea]THH41686.1 Patatin [Neolewinella litorea]
MEKLTIGITLSGGGARGAAHIGALRALTEAGIEPEKVVGVSAGALVGALYAAGVSPDDMMTFALESSIFRFYKLGMPLTGLTSSVYLQERLATVIPDNSFEQLQRHFYVGVTNLNTGQLECHDSGPLHELVAASCGIPFLFRPVVIDGAQYVDGGVIENMPVKPLLNQTDFIIGSNLMPYESLKPADVKTVIGIVWRCFDLSIMANTLPSAELCDVVLEPSNLNDYHIFNLNRLTDLHDVGYEHTRKRLPYILRLLESKRELLEIL